MFYHIPDSWRPYLNGQDFHNGLVLSYADNARQRNPVEHNHALRQLLEGQAVIHVGCADHLPLIKQKRASGDWLHDNLCKFAAHCLGIDINAKAINYLSQELGYQNIIEHDLTNPALPSAISERHWDAIFMGDVLEHIDNPIQFLTLTRPIYKGRVKQLIVSGPNAFTLQNVVFMLHGRECVNSDHRYWFTPYTLAKMLTLAGFTPTGYALTTRSKFVPQPGIAPDALLRMFPPGCDTITMVANF